MVRFKATIEPVPGGGHCVMVPPQIAEAAGLRYGARVRGTLAGAAYRSSLMKYSDVFYLGVHKATLAAADVAAGDAVDITIAIDDQPLPTDTVPPELAKALAGNRAAKAAFAALAPSHKREHVKYILDAKQAATRERRIAKTIATLAEARPKPKPSAKKPSARVARR